MRILGMMAFLRSLISSVHSTADVWGAPSLGGMHGYVDDLAAGHFDVADVLVEGGFEYNDLVSFLFKRHKSAQHAFIYARCDGYLGLGVDLTSKEWRVYVCEPLL